LVLAGYCVLDGQKGTGTSQKLTNAEKLEKALKVCGDGFRRDEKKRWRV
jgi:hypothetical protein